MTYYQIKNWEHFKILTNQSEFANISANFFFIELALLVVFVMRGWSRVDGYQASAHTETIPF